MLQLKRGEKSTLPLGLWCFDTEMSSGCPLQELFDVSVRSGGIATTLGIETSPSFYWQDVVLWPNNKKVR
jgi:hypothetical protein